MKRILLFLMLLASYIGYSKEFHVTYTTTEDQTTINHATIKIVPMVGDTIRVLLIQGQSVIVEFTGILHENTIDVIGDQRVEHGYLYKHLGKLRGSLFINNPNYICFILLIREK